MHVSFLSVTLPGEPCSFPVSFVLVAIKHRPETSMLLSSHRSLEELERVARGEVLYANFKVDVIDRLLGSQRSGTAQTPVPPRAQEQQKMPVIIPDQLISVQAYVMWEEANRPQVGGGGRQAATVTIQFISVDDMYSLV